MPGNPPDYAIQFGMRFELIPLETVLLVIDMQYASAHRETGLGRLLKDRGHEADGRYRFDRIEQEVVPRIRQLLSFFRERRLGVIFITVGSEAPDYSDLPQHMRGFAQSVGNTAGNREHEILDELAPLPSELRINKRTMSAFNSTGIDLVLKSRGIRSVLCCGVSTNSCVAGTARDAAEYGYNAVIVDDACGAASQELHDAELHNFGRLLGMVMATGEVMDALKSNL